MHIHEITREYGLDERSHVEVGPLQRVRWHERSDVPASQCITKLTRE